MTLPIEKIAFLVAAACMASFAGHVLAYDGHRLASGDEVSFATDVGVAKVEIKEGITRDVAQVRTPTHRDNRFAGDERN
jgi:hypothetical protein